MSLVAVAWLVMVSVCAAAGGVAWGIRIGARPGTHRPGTAVAPKEPGLRLRIPAARR